MARPLTRRAAFTSEEKLYMATLYFRHGYSQEQIRSQMNCSLISVSRAIKLHQKSMGDPQRKSWSSALSDLTSTSTGSESSSDSECDEDAVRSELSLGEPSSGAGVLGKRVREDGRGRGAPGIGDDRADSDHEEDDDEELEEGEIPPPKRKSRRIEPEASASSGVHFSSAGSGATGSPSTTLVHSTSNQSVAASSRSEAAPESATRLADVNVGQTRIPRSPTPELAYPIDPWRRAPDVSLVVSVGGTDYKLHESRICCQSDWFRDVLDEARRNRATNGLVEGLPEVSGTEVVGGRAVARPKITWDDNYHGFGGPAVPIVELGGAQGLEEGDWERLMDAVDNAITYFYSPPTLRDTYAVLRAAQLLRFTEYEMWARRRVADAWSDDLGHEWSSLDGACPVEAIEVGRTCGIPGVVRRGMYELLKDEMLGQSIDEDVGSCEDDEAQPKSILKIEDILVLTLARAKLQRAWIKATSQFPASCLPCVADAALPDHDPCLSARPFEVRELHRKLVIQNGLQDEYMNDVIGGLNVLTSLSWREDGVGGLCDGCRQRLDAVWRETRDKLWEDCIRWFGVRR
ncbi:hypothetical protein DFP72DRAFT_915651 [Ephemerocybe angulata]|uniref:BTB domain-containing protein n=1 Tax=Ephemerocybe angulata TaxID=980116 RepID=A0A8H6HM38_9AGAR|nr:hypothetical protein DFP72DRAFT_915651 [Tulosesus angulatus]